TVHPFALFLISLNLSLAHVVQPNVLMKVRLGDTVTFTCISKSSELFYVSWYKQPFGQKPRLMVQAYSRSPDSLFQEEFKNVARFSLQHSESSSNLTISKTELSDSAVYYCASVFLNEATFGDGTVLILTAQKKKHKKYVSLDSVTLQCTVDSETCAGEHSVYWFRHGSGESLPGLIYTHGNRSDECERSPEAGSPTHGCVYSLPKRNLSRSDAGIYYCAVATCGDILFGNGTVVEIQGNIYVKHCLGIIILLLCFTCIGTHSFTFKNKKQENYVLTMSCIYYDVIFVSSGFDCSSERTLLVWLSILRTGVLICVLLMFTIYHATLKQSQKQGEYVR
uniref:Ig-like domain-containing protein n=1 Tax=Scleropages formosus TaxID=113540 RepID=A0A8C9S0H2_SCLFO